MATPPPNAVEVLMVPNEKKEMSAFELPGLPDLVRWETHLYFAAFKFDACVLLILIKSHSVFSIETTSLAKGACFNVLIKYH